MDISSGRLQQLVVVARYGSISKAAEKLHISQPALSRSIAGFEEYYGLQIFTRVGHGVRLTAAGAQVLEQAEAALQALRVLDGNLRHFGSGQLGTLSIGMAPLLASQLLSQLSSDFFSTTGKVSLEVAIRQGKLLMQALKNDEIELAIYPTGYLAISEGIDVEFLGEIVPSCIVRASHPLATADIVTLEDLERFPWASAILPEIIGAAVKSRRFICDNYHILRESVGESNLVAIFSRAFVAEQLKDGSLREITVEGLPLPPTGIYSAQLSGRIRSPLAETAVEKISKYLEPQL